MKEGSPIISTFREAQQIQAHWNYQLGKEDSPQDAFVMAMGEMGELMEAVLNGDRKEIKGELADVVLFLSTIANHYGIQLDEAVSGKLRRNFDKYPPFNVQELQKEGHCVDSAMKEMKNVWDRSKDSTYL